MKTPTIAIIGPTNAGKSSLLNRLARRNIAITAREEGTTRDNVIARLDHYTIIDTAGLKDPTDDFERGIQQQIADAIEVADLILVLLDGTQHPDDKTLQIVRAAQKSHKPYIIALNKSDLAKSLPDIDFRHFGEKHLLRISATTGQGIKELQSTFEQKLGKAPLPSFPPDTPIKIALIGRPNVGKSSLYNALSEKQQALVSPLQGTTRDINRQELRFKSHTLELLDTAGLRRQGKREVGIEKFSALRTLSAIEESDICLLLIDATEPHSKLDQTLAGQIVDAGKSIILVITKTDLIDSKSGDPERAILGGNREGAPIGDLSTMGRDTVDRTQNTPTTSQILSQLETDFNFLPYAPVIITSSLTGKNLTRIFDLALSIYTDRQTLLKTSDLNKILEQTVKSHPPAGLKNTKPKLRYITQTDTAPPWFTIHGSDLQQLHWSYKRYLERQIREGHPFVGTPIFFSFQNRK